MCIDSGYYDASTDLAYNHPFEFRVGQIWVGIMNAFVIMIEVQSVSQGNLVYEVWTDNGSHSSSHSYKYATLKHWVVHREASQIDCTKRDALINLWNVN